MQARSWSYPGYYKSVRLFSSGILMNTTWTGFHFQLIFQISFLKEEEKTFVAATAKGQGTKFNILNLLNPKPSQDVLVYVGFFLTNSFICVRGSCIHL